MTKVNLKVRVSLSKDAWNVWDACNSSSHGMDWSKWAGPKLKKYVVGKKEQQAYKWLLPFLKEHHKAIGLRKRAKEIKAMLEPEFFRVIKTLEKITKKPFYRKDITLFLTTYPRCPYSWKKGYIWIRYNKDKNWQIHTLLHEMLHFQFMEYYGDEVWKAVGENKWDAIKEGMVVILSDYLKDWTGEGEKTYPIYEKFGKELTKIWKRVDGNFEKFIDESVKAVKKYKF